MRLAASIAALVIFVTACDAPASVPEPGATPTTVSSTSEPPPETTIPHDHETTTTTLPPGYEPIAVPVLRPPATTGSIYFLMTDRFANGDPTNDLGSLGADPLVSGYLPTDPGFFHGGDLRGVEQHLDYLQGLGVAAIWLTPPFVNDAVQGDGTTAGSSAGYHGYWQIDYTRVDPHLGTDADMVALIEAAHQRGMHVYFDVVANHTGDLIRYAGGDSTYVPKSVAPFLTADGTEFDDTSVAGAETFPELDPTVSFPYAPTFSKPGDAGAKAPDWLDDPTLYHNRGDSTFQGESSLYGDIFGLDDLFTEHPVVVAGFIEIFKGMIDRYDIDGFRVDTVKHVNDDFWETVIPEVLRHAEAAGKEDFLIFGEVFETDHLVASRYTTRLPFPALLDFGLNDAITQFVAEGAASKVLEDQFRTDDWYLDADSNASMMVTFAGNHDIGRIGAAVQRANPGADGAALRRRSELAMEALFLSRGVPVVYYGDEQGFTGDGGDKAARQDMFPSQVAAYNDDDLIATDATTADDNFDQEHPIYRRIADLVSLRSEHPSLVTGNHHSRWSEGEAGIYAFSRIDRDERVEYVVALNNADVVRSATFTVASALGTAFEPVYGPGVGVEVVEDDRHIPGVTVTIPALSAVVFRAEQPVPPPEEHAPTGRITSPEPGATVSFERFLIGLTLDDTWYCGRTCWPGLFVEVTFAVRVDGGEWQVIGTDDAPPFRLFWDSTAHPDGAFVEVIATIDDFSGETTVAWSDFTLGRR